MKKIVINKCYGGFSLSEAAYKELGLEWTGYGYWSDNDRTNPKLVAVVEKLGDAANGPSAKLKVVEIPEVNWRIDNYDGKEIVVFGFTPSLTDSLSV